MLEPCSVLTLRHPNLFFFTLHWITLRDTNKQILSIYTTGRRYRPSLRQCAVAWSNYLSWSEPRLPCVCRQFSVFLLAMTASTSLPITRRRIGSSTGSRHRLCYVQGRLLQYAVGRSTKVCYRQVAAGHERCSASCERHEEVRPWLDTPASLWAALARCGRSSHIQAWGDGVQVLAWPGTGLSAWAVHTGRSSCWTTASSFRQPPSTRCCTVSARYVRPSHLRCRWTNDMELLPKQFVWAGNANWLFSSYTENVSFLSVLGTLSALEAFFCDDALYTLTFTLHYITNVLLGIERQNLALYPWP